MSVQLVRVFGPKLDPTKKWYPLSSGLCGSKPSRFIKSKFFEHYSGEIAKVQAQELWREDGQFVSLEMFGDRSIVNTYVISTFGLFGGLISNCKGECKDGQLIERFKGILNTLDLSTEQSGTIKTELANTPKTSRIKVLQRELDHFKNKTREIEAALKHLNTPPTSPEDDEDNMYSSISNILKSTHLRPILKKRSVNALCKRALQSLTECCGLYDITFGKLLGNAYVYGDTVQQKIVVAVLSEAINVMVSSKGYRKIMDLITNEEIENRRNSEIRVPDWVQVYVKLCTKLPDTAWQTIINFLNIGRTGKNQDLQCILTKNMMKACKAMIFSRVQSLLGIKIMQNEELDLVGFGVGLPYAIIWAIREARLHHSAEPVMEFNIKLDGRPLYGKDQVSVSVVPINIMIANSESSDYCYPLAIANCEEKSNELRCLIKRLNEEKRAIKKEGISVDGVHYQIKFTVTLDYKALLLLICKIQEGGEVDLDFQLGGRGLNVEFCIFCQAIRACSKHLSTRFDETCLSCLQAKANIGHWTGMRDDLEFLLEEDLTNIQLCSLHQEMRNTEQLLGALGLLCHQVGALDDLNEVLLEYGPDNARKYDRIEIKQRPGQSVDAALTKNNIRVRSMSGPTERKILENSRSIVDKALPLQKLEQHYEESSSASASGVILKYIAYYEDVKKFLEGILNDGSFKRDYGDRQEKVNLNSTKVVFLGKPLPEYTGKKLGQF